MARDVVIVGAVRTPIGAFGGSLSSLRAPELGAVAIRGALETSGVEASHIDQLIMGCVLQAGVGQAPARQAAIFAGLPKSVPCVTVNKVCGSGLQAVVSAAHAIALGESEVAVAGGMESMSNAPYFSHAVRGGARMGHVELKDAMIWDGLWDVYNQKHMGSCGEACAKERGISRAAQDEYALTSTNRAIAAVKEGAFKSEIVPVSVPQKKGPPSVISEDEGPLQAKPEKIPNLKPAFDPQGTITAANASSISDGAAALVLTSADKAKAMGWKVLGKIVSSASAARAPEEFPIAPADAILLALKKAALSAADIDLWEINEAFALVTLANNQILKLDANRVNVRGGAVVLGHPIGASGARILVTLLSTMRDRNVRRGVASLCIGGGEGIAAVVERPG